MLSKEDNELGFENGGHPHAPAEVAHHPQGRVRGGLVLAC